MAHMHICNMGFLWDFAPFHIKWTKYLKKKSNDFKVDQEATFIFVRSKRVKLNGKYWKHFHVQWLYEYLFVCMHFYVDSDSECMYMVQFNSNFSFLFLGNPFSVGNQWFIQ